MELTFINWLLVYTACHFIADFPFQSVWMITEKGKNWEVLTYHCLTYTAPFVLVGALLAGANPWAYALLFGSHMIIDACKSRWKVFEAIWIDQLLHLSVILGLLLVGWL